MRAFAAVFAAFIAVAGIGCRSSHLSVGPQQIVGTWRYWPSPRCGSTLIVNDELAFASDGTYSQVTKLKDGTTFRSGSLAWTLTNEDTIHLEGWRNVFSGVGSMEPISADLGVDVRRPRVMGVRPLRDCYYSQPK